MKFSATFILSLALSSAAHALVVDSELVDKRDYDATIAQIENREAVVDTFDAPEELWKRKGGGGGGGRGGGSSGSSSSSGGSSSGSSGGSRGGSSGSSSGSSSGGTRGPVYGGGSYYGGGSANAYPAGQKKSGLTPILVGAGLGVGLGITAVGLSGAWSHRFYSYPYLNEWTFYNITTNSNQTKPVNCLCEEYSECGCEDNNNPEYQKELLGDGSYAGLDKSVVSVADYKGKSTIFINGTISNGTTNESPSSSTTNESSSTSTGSGFKHNAMQSGIYWVMAAAVGSAVFFA